MGKRCIKTLRQHNALPQQECMLDAKEVTRSMPDRKYEAPGIPAR